MKRHWLLLLIALGFCSPAQADVTAGGLGTRLNGVEGGRCSSGVCRIDGGSDAGRNRFHRLSEFDTRGAIQGVLIDSDGIRNLVLGVTAADGSFIDKSVSLTSPAHLFLLSPGGIQVMPGASFQQIPNLTLSTASQLQFAGGVFDVFNTPASAVAALSGNPFPGAQGLLSKHPGDLRPWIRIEGVTIDVDQALLVDAPGGRIDVESSRLSASNDSGDAGSLTLMADLVRVGEGSELLATGSGKGGLVQVGGSWQNSDATVRQATQVWMQPGSLVDASSTASGDGGTVVIWSDLANPAGGTVVEDTLLARGGPWGGDGGRIETSGAYLLAQPAEVDVSAPQGTAGEWLLDPYNITITAAPPKGDVFEVTDPSGGRLFESSASGSIVNTSDILSAMGSTSNVRIHTGPGGSEGGNIGLLANSPLNFSSSSGTLVLDASGYIQLNSSITTGSGGLILKAGAGFVEAASGTTLNLGGPLEIGTGDTTIGTAGFGAPALASTITGSGNLVKNGLGRLILSGTNSGWTGSAVVEAGSLRVTNDAALGAVSSGTRVQSGGTLEVSGGISLDEPVDLTGGALVNWAGDNTITERLLLIGSSTIDLRQDSLSLDPASGNAIAVDPGSVAYGSDLEITGNGDLVVKDPINLQDGQVTITAYGDLSHRGSGVLRLQDAVYLDRLESTGGGTVWMDQLPDGLSPVAMVLSTISLDNGAQMRRDGVAGTEESVTLTTLELGSGGGGITVGDGFTLVWNAPVTGSGDFSKEGEGTLRFPATADVSYTGATLVKAGELDVVSTEPASATCSGTGTSNRCPQPVVETPPVADDEPLEDEVAVLVEAVAEVPVFPPAEQSAQDEASTDPLADQSDRDHSAVSAGVAGSAVRVDVTTNDSGSEAQTTPLADGLTGGVVQTVATDRAADGLQTADQAATAYTASMLGLEPSGNGDLPASPSVEELKSVLEQVEAQQLAAKPAVLQVRFTAMRGQPQGQQADGFLDLTLVSAKAPVEARRVEVKRQQFAGLLKALYRQLSRQEPLAVSDPASPSRQLHALLVQPLQESLDTQGIQTLLIAADQGLQAVPFAALSDGKNFFGDRYAFGLTPSLALTRLVPAQSRPQGQLALGASQFEGLVPLPLVPQELERIDAVTSADRYLNRAFSPKALLDGAADRRYSRVHVATHADFRPGGPTHSVLHTGTGPMPMAQFAQLRRQRADAPLDLVVLSACRTLLGDQASELGFAGLALQAGSRSAIGTLWYVDDVVTSAFFVQFYRLLDQGLPKATALQRTRQLFSSGQVRLVGDEVIGADGQLLLDELSASQRRRMATGVGNPFFWAGIELIGSPW